jgi:LmbE family N-acetylglucosaminyl deacetylase
VNVLAVGAHRDDIELGCGGTLARLAREGHTTFGLTLTNSETHDRVRGIHRTTEQAVSEARRAASVLGLQLVDVEGAQRDNGTLLYDVELMRRIEALIAEKQIALVFSHWRRDLNTDHEAAAKMTIVAARHVPSVLMYRSNWYQPAEPFNGTFLVDISDVVETKRRCLACYEGEIKNRSPAWIESFFDSHRTAGFALGRAYAEAFEPVRFEWRP